MLIFLPSRLAFLATPKTGTTAVETALKSQAEIIFRGSRKHTPAMRFRRKVVPFVENTFGVQLEGVAVMRDPVDQIASWFRYRSSDRLEGSPLSTAGLSFEQFVMEVIDDDPPPRAQIGSQFSFMTNGDGKVMVDHIFAYESQPAFRTFMADRLGKGLKFKAKNVSPPVRTDLSNQAEQRLRQARAAEFALYEAVVATKGHLHTPLP
ncbi:hypothetical protein [Sulfitobacter sp. JB4-11]|uniref:hypothetical protein n=1 Tax=Sulfitobacter rhodophyticola TaxID=3238304 RepID=UPI0035160ED0